MLLWLIRRCHPFLCGLPFSFSALDLRESVALVEADKKNWSSSNRVKGNFLGSAVPQRVWASGNSLPKTPLAGSKVSVLRHWVLLFFVASASAVYPPAARSPSPLRVHARPRLADELTGKESREGEMGDLSMSEGREIRGANQPSAEELVRFIKDIKAKNPSFGVKRVYTHLREVQGWYAFHVLGA